MEFPTDWAWPDSADRQVVRFKQYPEDFCVDEHLGFTPSGKGEHLLIQIKKTGLNSADVAAEIGSLAGVKARDVGYCGMKDRHAVTTQWFSVASPHELAWSHTQTQVLSFARHDKKLRRGQHAANRFQLILRGVEGPREGIEARLRHVAERGFPNYFGAQRFGYNGDNLTQGWSLLQKRRLKHHRLRGIYLSALRSWLFNRVLSQQIKTLGWPGLVSACSELRDVDVATGPLWGRGPQRLNAPGPASEECALTSIEQAELWANRELANALEFTGLSQERRALIAMPEALHWHWLDEQTLALTFGLGVGQYATSLLSTVALPVDASHSFR